MIDPPDLTVHLERRTTRGSRAVGGVLEQYLPLIRRFYANEECATSGHHPSRGTRPYRVRNALASGSLGDKIFHAISLLWRRCAQQFGERCISQRESPVGVCWIASRFVRRLEQWTRT